MLALPFLISLQLLVPYIVKFNVGISLNVFNLSVLTFVLLFFLSRQKNMPINLQIGAYLKGYLLYVCLYSFIASFGTITFAEYIQNMILFFFEYIGMAYCLNYVRFDKRSIRYFNMAIIISSIIIIVYGLLNYVVKVNPYIMYISMVADKNDMANKFMEEQRGFLDGRISSTFIHPLQLGQASLLLFCYILYEMREKLNKVLFMSLLIGLVVMCLLSGSRSAVFPLVVAAFFYIRSVRIRKKFLGVIGFVSALSLAYLVVPQNIQETLKAMVFVWDEKASAAADIHGSSISGRADQYIAALKITKEDFLFGYGKGYVAKHGSNHPEMLGYESFVLSELVDGGICGLLAFVFFYFLVYRALLRKVITPLERARIHSLCSSFFVSALLTGISYSFFSLYMTFCMISYHNILKDKLGLVPIKAKTGI